MISILTTPARTSIVKIYHMFRHPKSNIINLIKYAIFLIGRKENFYLGHSAVTRSLIKGLGKVNFLFNYNPKIESIGTVCIVLSGVETVQSAINLKRTGKIKRLYAGPNIAVLPIGVGEVLASPEIDGCIVPSEWVRKLYISYCKELNCKVLVWPAGVDTEFWKPDFFKNKSEVSQNILVYLKGDKSKDFFSNFNEKYNLSNFNFIIIKYGSYSPAYYKKKLSETDLMIVIGETESQGIAMVEAWSMNVATLVKYDNTWVGPDGRNHVASSSPYLTNETGVFFKNNDELYSLLQDWRLKKLSFSPRSWVVDNMSDEISSRNLLSLISSDVLIRGT